MSDIGAIILAAGKGTRMKSDLPKVLHKINDKALAEYVIDAVFSAGIDKVCLVIGYQADLVKENIHRDVTYAYQEEQLGTGHAVMCAKDFIPDEGDTLILCGDTPLITGVTLKKLMDYHKNEGNYATVLSAIMEDPTGYGRIIRDKEGNFVKNVEHKDASEEERKVCEINSGMYIFNSKELKEGLSGLTTDNAQGEYYLPDVIVAIRNKGLKVGAYCLDDPEEIFGINTVEQLEQAGRIIDKR
ncbi:MAG: NTP transferase domain-containing protein [Lachnospiraceae bacterium]|nr:NTP transferase domain-containing protein [Lachnospiraceae bacterium]